MGTIFTEETGVVMSPIAAGLPEEDMVSDLPGNRGTVFASRSTQTRQKDDTKFVILNATFNIFKVNATGSVYRHLL